MGLFNPKQKGINFAHLQAIADQGARAQKELIKGAFAETPQLLDRFKQTQGQLGEGFVTGAGQRAQQFAKGLTGLESPEMVRQQQAKATELAFRNLPQAQQMIRENLAATGGLGRGAAIRALQQPVLQASQQAADTSFQIQQAAQARDLARQQQALETIFNTGQGAALQKLGIDLDTANVLLETGRSDILDRAFRLAGIEAGRTQGMMDIEMMRQQQEIAKDRAKRMRQGQLLNIGGSLIGGLIGGKAGGPIGAMAGSQIGGQVGNIAGLATGKTGGAQGGTDLSGLLALMAMRGRGGGGIPAGAAGVETMRQRVPWPTSRPMA